MNNYDLDAFNSRRSTMYAPNGVVAASQPLAAEAGIQILREGGNAFDAAVSTAATLNVVEPTSTGLGGDVFALYRTAEGEVGAMRSCGGAPAHATIESVREAIAEQDGEELDEIEMPAQGAHTVTVPGTARGWERTIENLGQLTLEEVLSPAIKYAIEGYPVTEVIASHWRAAEDLFIDRHAREAYLLDGASPKIGEIMTLPNLGESLRAIAEEGADVVYEGWIGEAIVGEIREKGGLMNHEDLASFEPEFVDPVSTTYRDAEIYELPPNNQGLIVLEALNILSELDVKESTPETDRTHYAIEALKRAFHDGHHYITDPDHEEIPPLGSPDWARKRANVIGERAGAVEIGVPGANAEDADTVLLTTADAEGNVVSYINSRFSGFGSGLVAGETGIALQNRGSSFSLDPEHPNSLQPGKRPFHTLIPGLAHLDTDDWAAFGVMGGYMQPQGQLQVLTNLLEDGMSLQAALNAPRWRYHEDGSLAVEARMDSALQNRLVRRGHDVRIMTPSDFGGAQIARNNGGTLSGATEPRKDGIVSGY